MCVVATVLVMGVMPTMMCSFIMWRMVVACSIGLLVVLVLLDLLLMATMVMSLAVLVGMTMTLSVTFVAVVLTV